MATEFQTIVIVEDDPETANMFGEMVRLLGYRVKYAQKGGQAVGIIAETKPTAVLLDWILPDMSGLQVMRLLNKDTQLAKIPVVMISAKSLPSDVDKGKQMGASAYLTKPLDFQDLENALNTLIVR